MGKAAKAHRAKVAKRNANMKQQEKKMQKLWQEAFEEQMKTMKEKFTSMSGDTNISGNSTSENIILGEEIKDDQKNEDFKKMKEELSQIFNIEKSMEISEELKKEMEPFNNELIESISEGLLGDEENLLENFQEILEIINDNSKDFNEDEKNKLNESLEEMKNTFNSITSDDIKQKNIEETTQEQSEPTEPVQGE